MTNKQTDYLGYWVACAWCGKQIVRYPDGRRMEETEKGREVPHACPRKPVKP